ncbi:MAG: RNA polymerase sigma factor [Angelakisella sp.]|nr:RNA polymerase sigma factor [Angelakisella sp.]
MTTKNFDNVVKQYQRLVYTICYQMVQDHFEAQNLTQETFLSAYTHLESCRENELKPWLARIATNKARDHLKSAYHRRVQLEEEDAPQRAAPTWESPDNIYIVSEGEQVIRDKIQSLKEPYLAVSVLFFLQEKNVDEIAEELGRPKKTVQTQIYRARLQLRELLKEANT